MLRTRKKKFSPAEYLAMEEVADYKSEYFRGEIYAFSGGSADHGLIAVNIGHQLTGFLDAAPCRVYNSDVRLHVRANKFYTYPDVMVVCGKVQYMERRNDTILNPLVIVEVLSPATRDYDRGAKFELYKEIASFNEYVLVESERPRVECYRRLDSGEWTVRTSEGLETVLQIASLNFELTISRIYHKVSWREE
jgi:Uma2 family endonuclease